MLIKRFVKVVKLVNSKKKIFKKNFILWFFYAIFKAILAFIKLK